VRGQVGYPVSMTAAVIGIVRVGTWMTVCALAVLGLITAGSAVVVPVIVTPVAGALVAWALARHRGETPSRTVAAIAFGAAVAGVGVLAIAGLATVIGVATVPAAAALGGLLVWLHRGSPRRSARPQAALAAEAPLRSLSNTQLARAWQSSYADLTVAHDAVTLGRICSVRKQQLDEIERRDPTGFHRWISSGYWVRGDSAPFLG
jgi:hypothetical protein